MSYSRCQQCMGMVPNREPLCPWCGPELYKDPAKARQKLGHRPMPAKQGPKTKGPRPMPHPSGLTRAQRRKRAALERRNK